VPTGAESKDHFSQRLIDRINLAATCVRGSCGKERLEFFFTRQMSTAGMRMATARPQRERSA